MNQKLKTKFGLRIKELRVSNKLTQEQLAELIGMERTNLTRIEAGKQFPSAENIEKFASVLNTQVDNLFNFGHLKKRQELIEEIIYILKAFDIEKVRFIHKSVTNLKNVK